MCHMRRESVLVQGKSEINVLNRGLIDLRIHIKNSFDGKLVILPLLPPFFVENLA